MVNIAELLKDCPQGMELDCTMYDKVSLVHVSEGNDYPIKIETPVGQVCISKYGQYHNNKHAKCIIFPKGKTTWEGFHKPFEDGDIIYVDINTLKWVSIFKKYSENEIVTYADCELNSHTIYGIDRNKYSDVLCDNHAIEEIRLATEEEKQKLFDAIKENGYAWNAETKTLEKLNGPRFKVGDVVKTIYKQYRYVITGITDTHYTLEEIENKFKYTEPIIEDKNWELIPKKFDITTLKPLESKVLMRSSNAREWVGTIYSHYNKKFHGCGMYCDQCIPYEGNEHLLGTIDDCDDYYKVW